MNVKEMSVADLVETVAKVLTASFSSDEIKAIFPEIFGLEADLSYAASAEQIGLVVRKEIAACAGGMKCDIEAIKEQLGKVLGWIGYDTSPDVTQPDPEPPAPEPEPSPEPKEQPAAVETPDAGKDGDGQDFDPSSIIRKTALGEVSRLKGRIH